MDNQTTMYVVIGLLAIFFIVLLIFSAKTWRVLHMMSIFLVFVASGFLIWFAAAALQTNANWRHAVTVLSTKVAAEEEAARLLLEGSGTEDDRPDVPDSPFADVDFVEDSIQDVRAALERMLVDRGRVWRGCTPEVNNPAGPVSITLTIPAVAAAPVDDAGAEPEVAEPPVEPEAPADAAEPPADGEVPPAEAEPPVDAPPAAPAGAHGIEVNIIVYGFLEGPSELSGKLRAGDGAEPFATPQLYLGEFRVTDRTNSTITLQPTIRLTPLQASNLAAGNWTIYDNMPVDSHYAYAGLSEEDLRVLFPHERLSMSTDQYDTRIAGLTRFFDGMTPAELSALIPMSSVVMDDAQYEQFVGRYTRTGEAADVDNDSPQRIWRRVSFKMPTSIQVDGVLDDIAGDPKTTNFATRSAIAVKRSTDVVVIGEPSLIGNQAGDANLGTVSLGMTMTDSLKQVSDFELDALWNEERTKLRLLTELSGEELETVREAKSTEFDIGDTALLDPTTAKFLIDNGIADEIEAVYVRQLRDYATYFNEGYGQELLFEDDASVIKQDTITLRDANAKALEQVDYRADEISKLQQDREGFQREAAAIAEVLAKVEAREKATRARLSKLFRTNLQLAEQIRKIQTNLAESARPAVADGAALSP